VDEELLQKLMQWGGMEPGPSSSSSKPGKDEDNEEAFWFRDRTYDDLSRAQLAKNNPKPTASESSWMRMLLDLARKDRMKGRKSRMGAAKKDGL